MEIKLTKGKQEDSIIEFDKDYKFRNNIIIFYGPNGVGKTSMSKIIYNNFQKQNRNKYKVELHNEFSFINTRHIKEEYFGPGNKTITIHPYYKEIEEIRSRLGEGRRGYDSPLYDLSDASLSSRWIMGKIIKFGRLSEHNKNFLNKNFIDAYSKKEIVEYFEIYNSSISENVKELLLLCYQYSDDSEIFPHSFIKAMNGSSIENEEAIKELKEQIIEIDKLKDRIDNSHTKYKYGNSEEKRAIENSFKRLKSKLKDLIAFSFYDKEYFSEIIGFKNKNFEEIKEFYNFLKTDKLTFKQKIFFTLLSSSPELMKIEGQKKLLAELDNLIFLNKRKRDLIKESLKIVQNNFKDLESVVANLFNIKKTEVQIQRFEDEVILSFPRDIRTLSTGERHIFNIIFNLLFFFNFSDSETLILDDPWSSFDELNKKLILNILLTSIKNYPNKQVIIFTHDFFMFLLARDFFGDKKFNSSFYIIDKIYNQNITISKLSIKKIEVQNKKMNIVKNKRSLFIEFWEKINSKICEFNFSNEKEKQLGNLFKVGEKLLFHYNLNSTKEKLNNIEAFICDDNKKFLIEKMNLEDNFENLIVYKLIFLITERLRIERAFYLYIEFKEINEENKKTKFMKLNGKPLRDKFLDFRTMYPDFEQLNGFLLSKFMDLNDSVHIISDQAKNLDYSSYIFNASTYFIVNETQKIENILKIEEAEDNFDKK